MAGDHLENTGEVFTSAPVLRLPIPLQGLFIGVAGLLGQLPQAADSFSC